MAGSIKHQIALMFFDFAYGIIYRERGERRIWEEKREGNHVASGAFRMLRPTLRYWYADPIPAYIDGEEYLFCEVFDRKKQKGLIGVSTFDTHGRLSRPQVILEESFHLSFPLVFTYQGETYLLPESEGSNELRLYRMNGNAFSFNFERTLCKDVKLVDTVVFEQDGELLFLSCEENEENPKETRLRLFGTHDLKNGEFTEYPVMSKDYSYATRNGGPIVTDGKRQLRVIQESTPNEYGRNLKITELRQLSRNGLEEDFLRDIFLDDLSVPWPGTYRRQGTHTYGCGEKHEFLDVSFNRFHLGNIGYFKK